MKWLREHWLKTFQYLFMGFVLYLCGLMFYNWLEFNGSVGEKLFLLVIIIILTLVFTADFMPQLIKWTKNTFGDWFKSEDERF